jgi:hypothetical protein
VAIDLAVIMGDGLLMAGTVTAAVVTSRRTRSKLDTKIDAHTERVDERLTTIQKQTDSRLDERIKAAVEIVARDHPGLVSNAVATQAVTLLLDAILESQLEDDESEHGRHFRRRLHER